MHLRDRLLVRGRARLRIRVERDRVLLRVRGADELVVPAGRVDRDVVRVQRDEERGVGLVRGDRRLREEGDLPAGDVLRVDEVPAGPAARLLEDVDDVRLVERQHEAALQRHALRVGRGASRPRRRRGRAAARPARGAGRRRARARRGRAGARRGRARRGALGGVAWRALRRGARRAGGTPAAGAAAPRRRAAGAPGRARGPGRGASVASSVRIRWAFGPDFTDR